MRFLMFLHQIGDESGFQILHCMLAPHGWTRSLVEPDLAPGSRAQSSSRSGTDKLTNSSLRSGISRRFCIYKPTLSGSSRAYYQRYRHKLCSLSPRLQVYLSVPPLMLSALFELAFVIFPRGYFRKRFPQKRALKESLPYSY